MVLSTFGTRGSSVILLESTVFHCDRWSTLVVLRELLSLRWKGLFLTECDVYLASLHLRIAGCSGVVMWDLSIAVTARSSLS